MQTSPNDIGNKFLWNFSFKNEVFTNLLTIYFLKLFFILKVSQNQAGGNISQMESLENLQTIDSQTFHVMHEQVNIGGGFYFL